MPGRAGVDPHFLHKTRVLDPLVSPPVDQPRALAWLPKGDALLVASMDGTVAHVEPSFGTRSLLFARPDPAALAIDGDELAILGRDGVLQVWSLAGPTLRWEQPTGLVAHLHVVWFRGGVAVGGDDLTERRAYLFDRKGKRIARARLPARTVLGADAEGNLLTARTTTVGLAVVPFGKPLPLDEPTRHALHLATSGAVIGIATGGLTMWTDPAQPPVSVKLYDVSAGALAPDGEHVALGTRTGSVALAWAVPGKVLRSRPAQVEGHETPVVSLAFAPRGRWLASVADRCRVWCW